MTPVGDEPEAMDPTRTGPPLWSGKSARLSKNEIEQLCLKAARGAGMSWGMAEEAGFAAAWLAARGFDGPGALLAQLRKSDGQTWREICPVIDVAEFRAASGGHLCPIALGSALCDHVSLRATRSERLRVGPVSHPILLMPFLADIARFRQHSMRVVWAQGRVEVTAQGIALGDTGVLADLTTLEAEILTATGPDHTEPKAAPRLEVVAATLNALGDFALRITVPASEASRAGAGAGGDND